MKWQLMADLAEHQHGVVSRAQLAELGFSERTVTRLAAERSWLRPHPGVFVIPGAPRTFPQRALAAQLALPVPSVITAAAAAHLHGLRKPPRVVDLLVGEHDRLVAPEGTHLTRTRTLLDCESIRVGAMRVATGPRMLIDYASRAQPADLRALIIDARQRRLVELPRLSQRLAEIGPVRGRGTLKRLVWELDEERCDSVLESEVRKLLSRAGLPKPAPAPVPVRVQGRTIHVDIGWPDLRVGIEVDGFAYHSTRRQLDIDHRRTNALALANWTVLRVSWDRVERDPDAFVAEVRRLLARKLEDLAQIRA